MPNGSTKINHIPARKFVSAVESLIEMEADPTDLNTASVLVSAMQRLEHDSGLSRRTLYMHFSGKTEWIRFDTADKILCALGASHLWRLPPLDEVYTKVSLRDEPPPKRSRAQIPRPTCAAPGCWKRFPIRLNGGSRKKYCSVACRKRAARQRSDV